MPATHRAMRAVAAVASAVLLLAGCGQLVGDDPVEVSLAALVAEQDQYDGRLVITEGLVRTFDDPRHYWIEDDAEAVNRVELLPEEEVAPHLGEQVRVVGRFEFDPEEGRRIHLDEIEPLTETPQAL